MKWRPLHKQAERIAEARRRTAQSEHELEQLRARDPHINDLAEFARIQLRMNHINALIWAGNQKG